MKIKIADTPVESGQTSASINIADFPQPRIIGFEEIIYEKLIELNEELKRMNRRLDEILGEEK